MKRINRSKTMWEKIKSGEKKHLFIKLEDGVISGDCVIDSTIQYETVTVTGCDCMRFAMTGDCEDNNGEREIQRSLPIETLGKVHIEAIDTFNCSSRIKKTIELIKTSDIDDETKRYVLDNYVAKGEDFIKYTVEVTNE